LDLWALPGPPTTHLVGLADGPQRDPHSAHHGVPDEPLVPHLHSQPQVQAVDLTVGRGGSERPLPPEDTQHPSWEAQRETEAVNQRNQACQQEGKCGDR
jgi:hypothetical protein